MVLLLPGGQPLGCQIRTDAAALIRIVGKVRQLDFAGNGIGFDGPDIVEIVCIVIMRQQPDSLYNTYRRIIRLKNQNPAIARGEITEVLESEDVYFGGYYVEYEGEKLLIIHYGGEETKEFEITEEMLANAEFRGGIVTSNAADFGGDPEKWNVTFKKGTLTMPPMSTAVLKAN